MLLGSPPDMVHGFPLRGTDLSSPLTGGRRHSAAPGAGIHPCCSGLQVQGTANSPTSAALQDRTPAFGTHVMSVTPAASSETATPRHTKRSA